MTEITQEDTIEMIQGDWKIELRAEYWQAKIREWENKETDFIIQDRRPEE